MSRSLKKGPFVEARLIGRIDDMNKRNERKVLKTWSRASVIMSSMRPIRRASTTGPFLRERLIEFS